MIFMRGKISTMMIITLLSSIFTPFIQNNDAYDFNSSESFFSSDGPVNYTIESETIEEINATGVNPDWSGCWGNPKVPTENAIAHDSNGYTHIIFRENGSSALLYTTNYFAYLNEGEVVWNDAYIGGLWRTTYVNTEASVCGDFDLAIDSNNRLHISYFDQIDKKLKYTTNSSGYAYFESSWVVTSVGDENSGYSNSIAIDSNDKVHISYTDERYSFGNYEWSYNLNYATNLNFEYFGYWNTDVIMDCFGDNDQDEDFAGVFDTSIAIDSNDTIHVAYYNQNTRYDEGLWYASQDKLFKTWENNHIDTDTYAGAYPSIAIDSDSGIHISYSGSYSHSSTNLKYAYSMNGSIWNLSTVDSQSGTGIHPSIVLDVKNNIHISYYDEYNNDLKYAFSSGNNSWELELIESIGESHRDSSMVIGSDGNLHISHFNNSTEIRHTQITYPDYDGDGIGQLIDKCPDEDSTGFDNNSDGCMDDGDGDGITDLLDLCEGYDDAIDVDSDQVPDDCDDLIDNDGDGFSNDVDLFPEDSSEAFDTDGDGIGDNSDLDHDNDGVINENDAWEFDHLRHTDTDGDGLADYVEGITSGRLIDFESGDYDGVGIHCSEDLAGFCMPDYPPWAICGSNPIGGEYSICQKMWASDTGYFSIGFSSWNDSVVTLDVYITSYLINKQCIPIYLDGNAIDYGCNQEGFSSFEHLSINVSAGSHELRFYGRVIGEGNTIDNIQLPDYLISVNEDEDDDNDGFSDELETSFPEDSLCRSDPLDSNSTPMNNSLHNSSDYVYMEYDFGECNIYYDSDGDELIDIDDECPNEFGDDGFGCPTEEKEESASGSDSSQNIIIGSSVGLLILVILVGLLIVRRKRDSDSDDWFEDDEEMDKEMTTFSPPLAKNDFATTVASRANPKHVDSWEDLPDGEWLESDEEGTHWYLTNDGTHWYSTDDGYRVWDES